MDKKFKVYYAMSVYDDAEIQAVVDVLKTKMPMVGQRTKEFEAKIANLFNKKYGIMVNSGSSANMIALNLLKLKPGSEAVTPVLTFSTTVSPLLHNGIKPVFVDVEPYNCIVDVKQMKDAIDRNTKVLMIPSLMGNIPDMEFIRKTADDTNTIYVEDSCDTLLSKFNGKSTGAYSQISTTSFYGSHMMTAAAGGGMLCVNEPDWNMRARHLRGWGRSSAADESEDIESRFGKEVGGMKYDSKFVYEEIGYNCLPIEIEAAFGLEQLKKLPGFAASRRRNFDELKAFFSKYKDFFVMPSEHEKAEVNWLAFPLIIKEGAPFERHEMVIHLEKEGIQTRPIFTGNILRQPAFKNISHREFRKDFPNADYAMEHGFVIGCHHGMTPEHLDYVRSTFSGFLDRF